MPACPTQDDLTTIEANLLLEGIFQRYGYDFREYSRPSLIRRLEECRQRTGTKHFAELLHMILEDESTFSRVLSVLSVTVTKFFRDPLVYATLRQKVLARLHTYPFLKIWHAGCATGEEVISMAILLHEEGLLARTQLYGTDLNDASIEQSQRGRYSLKTLEEGAENYRRAGGKHSFFDYFTMHESSGTITSILASSLTYSTHNLVTDQSFGEMNLIVCRNVLIYFDQPLQNRVLRLFAESLCHRGFLCLGTDEMAELSEIHDQFTAVASKEKIYQQV